VVRGTTSSNSAIKKVVVNGHEARALRDNFAEWEIALENPGSGMVRLTAHAEDIGGDIEQTPHAMTVGRQ
jgi:hypothetical protein